MNNAKLIVRIKATSKFSYVLVVDAYTGNKFFDGTIQGFRFWLDDFQHDHNIDFIY